MSKERLQEVNTRILHIKQTMKRFKNYRKWWKVLYWYMYSKQDIEDWIDKYKILLRFEVWMKRSILKQLENK